MSASKHWILTLKSERKLAPVVQSTVKLTLCTAMGIAIAVFSFAALADNFKMPCEVKGIIPALEDKELPAARVTLEIETIGNNIFMRMTGSKQYEMKLSTLATKVFTGTNLTNPKHLGVRSKNNETGQEGELTVDQKTVSLSGYNDIDFQGKVVRLKLSGVCTLPK